MKEKTPREFFIILEIPKEFLTSFYILHSKFKIVCIYTINGDKIILERKKGENKMREIYIYTCFSSWLEEKPDAVINGTVLEKNSRFIELADENGYTQILVLDKLFAVVY